MHSFINLEFDTSTLEKDIIIYDPPIEIENVELYRLQNPSSALIICLEEGTPGGKKKLLYEGPATSISLLFFNSNIPESNKSIKNRDNLRCILPDNWMEQMKIDSDDQEKSKIEKKYTFLPESKEKVNELMETWPGGGKILNILDLSGKSYREKKVILFGQLKTLFGEPLWTTPNVEEAYSYCISATDENNHTIYLDVYSGASGPAIGSFDDKQDCQEAAKQLRNYILQSNAIPTDYDYEGTYENEIIIKMGIKNGCPYYEEATVINDFSYDFEDENEIDILTDNR